MSLVSTIYVPKESVNDDSLSLISVNVTSGDFVKKDSLLAELETSKAIVEVRADTDGYVKVYVEPGTDISIGSRMFEFYTSPVVVDEKQNVQSIEKRGLEHEESLPVRTRFSKAARRYMEEHALSEADFSSCSFVTTKDLLKAQGGRRTNTEKRTLSEENNNDTLFIEKTVKSIAKSKKLEFDYLYSVNSSSVISRISTSIQVSGLDAIAKSQHSIQSTPLPSIIHEVSKLLLKYPNLNSFYLNGDQAFHNKVNVGFALDNGENGLKVAAISNSNHLSLGAIEEKIAELTLKYLESRLNVQELTSATFTITDLFNANVFGFHPLVNKHNASILGISSLRNGEFILDMSFDHRLSSGKEVSQFLNDLKYRLEARFGLNKNTIATSQEVVVCAKCLRGLDNDLNGQIFFQKVVSSRYNGYLCSNCLSGW